MSEGTVRTGYTKDLTSWDENPLFVTKRTCIIFLQELFSYAPSGSFKWDQDDSATELTITSDVPLHTESIERRPAIAVTRSGAAFAGIGMDQLEWLNLRTGAEAHTDMISGNLTFNCMSRVDTEAEYLGWQVARHLWIFKHYLMQQGFHKIGEQSQILPPTPPGALISGDTEAEIVNVAVITPFHFQWRDVIVEENLPVAENVIVNMTARMADVLRKTNVRGPTGTSPMAVKVGAARIRPPMIRGQRLRIAQPRQYPGSQSSDPPVDITIRVEE